jgi:hypothetical protein
MKRGPRLPIRSTDLRKDFDGNVAVGSQAQKAVLERRSSAHLEISPAFGFYSDCRVSMMTKVTLCDMRLASPLRCFWWMSFSKGSEGLA